MSEGEKERKMGKKPGDGGDPEKWCRGGGMRGGSGGGEKKGIEWREGKERREREGRGESAASERGCEKERSSASMDGWVDEWDAPLPTFPKLQLGARFLCLLGWGKLLRPKLTVLLVKLFCFDQTLYCTVLDTRVLSRQDLGKNAVIPIHTPNPHITWVET